MVVGRGIELVLRIAFLDPKLHRIEANIQPGSRTAGQPGSRARSRRKGFGREGLSAHYLKISGRWRDHERQALLAEECPIHGLAG